MQRSGVKVCPALYRAMNLTSIQFRTLSFSHRRHQAAAAAAAAASPVTSLRRRRLT